MERVWTTREIRGDELTAGVEGHQCGRVKNKAREFSIGFELERCKVAELPSPS